MLEKIKNKHLLIDGDIYKYRCAAVAEKTKYLVEDTGSIDGLPKWYKYDSYKEAINAAHGEDGYIWSRKEVQPVEFALQACKSSIETLVAKLTPSKVSVFLSPERNFRCNIARTKPYKGNRSPVKPKYLKDVENYLIKEYGATVATNIEADDEIGANLSSEGDRAVSVSIDKDLLQVPGWHYNWVTDGVQRITPRAGDFNFYTQMLTGDVTDNIPGVPGIGPAKSREILSGAKSRAELCSRVWGEYKRIFGDTDRAIDYFYEQADLLWIWRSKEEGVGRYIAPITLE